MCYGGEEQNVFIWLKVLDNQETNEPYLCYCIKIILKRFNVDAVSLSFCNGLLKQIESNVLVM